MIALTGLVCHRVGIHHVSGYLYGSVVFGYKQAITFAQHKVEVRARIFNGFI